MPKYSHPAGRDVFEYATHDDRFECTARLCDRVGPYPSVLEHHQEDSHEQCHRDGCGTCLAGTAVDGKVGSIAFYADGSFHNSVGAYSVIEHVLDCHSEELGAPERCDLAEALKALESRSKVLARGPNGSVGPKVRPWAAMAKSVKNLTGFPDDLKDLTPLETKKFRARIQAERAAAKRDSKKAVKAAQHANLSATPPSGKSKRRRASAATESGSSAQSGTAPASSSTSSTHIRPPPSASPASPASLPASDQP